MALRLIDDRWRATSEKYGKAGSQGSLSYFQLLVGRVRLRPSRLA